MATGKQIEETNNDKSERWKQHRSVQHSVKEVGSECIKLTDDQTRVLGKGLNFEVTPDKLPVEEFIIAMEQAC